MNVTELHYNDLLVLVCFSDTIWDLCVGLVNRSPILFKVLSNLKVCDMQQVSMPQAGPYLLHRVGDRDLHDRAAVSACCTAGVPMVFIALKQDGIIIGRCTH